MLKHLILTATLGTVTGLLLSASAVRCADAGCNANCKEDDHWIFDTDGLPNNDCLWYDPEIAQVGHVNGGGGMKEDLGPRHTVAFKRCPRALCDPVCTPVVTTTWHESDDGDIMQTINCVQLNPVEDGQSVE